MFGIKIGKAARTANGAPPELVDALRVLKTISDSMFSRSIAYVVNGEEPGLVREVLAAKDDSIFEYLWSPGDIVPSITDFAKRNDYVAKRVPGWSMRHSNHARDILYQRIDVLSAGQMVRFARLLLASRRGKPMARPTLDGPEWMPCLLFDVMRPDQTQIRGYGSNNSFDPGTWVANQRSAWTPEYLHALLIADRLGEEPQSEEADARLILSTCLDRVGLAQSRWFPHGIDLLPRMVGFSSFAVGHASLLSQLVPGFVLDGKRAFIKFARTDPTVIPSLVGIIADLVQDNAKAVRNDALSLVAGLTGDEQIDLLEPLLLTAPTASVGDIVAAITRLPDGAVSIGRVLAASAGSPGAAIARRREALNTAVNRSTALSSSTATLEIPPYVRADIPALGDDFVERAMLIVGSVVETQRELARSVKNGRARWGGQDAKRIVDEMNGFGRRQAQQLARYLSEGGPRPPFLAALALTPFAGKFTGLGLFPTVRLFAEYRHPNDQVRFSVPWWHLNAAMNGDLDFDLRAIDDALQDSGFPNPKYEIAQQCFPRWGAGLNQFSDEHIWPYWAERLDIVKQLLKIESGTFRTGDVSPEDITNALRVVGIMPDVPPDLLPRITELALSEGKTHRLAAQLLLERRPGVVGLASGALSDSKLEIRSSAATWLGRIGDPSAIPALRRTLAKEKREVVKAALLAALEQLGDDISKDLAPTKLAAEAAAGLRSGMPTALDWFPSLALPPAKWVSNGKAVPTEVLQWWVALATKLKEPGGGGIIGRYLSLLTPESREELGAFVLSAWIARDTRHPSDAECRAVAEAEAPKRYAQMQAWAKQYASMADMPQARFTIDDWFEVLRREKIASYSGSAIAEKGVLALASGMRGDSLVQAIQRFMKDHYLKRAQIEALITVAASSDDLGPTQLVLATARRHRTLSVQARARLLVEELSERRNWSPEELADRTIPTAGFDDDGLLRLSFGGRAFIGRITPTNTLQLSDEAGKVIKALPAARANESAELVSEAKSQLAASKKELKQQLGMQTERLYEAMCVERTWKATDFTEFLVGHPLMSRLISRVVWMVRPSAESAEYELFRPDSGQLIDAEDGDLVLPGGGVVQVAHASLITTAETAAWAAHLQDYDITPLFGQLQSSVPVVAAGATEFTDREGWLADSFSVRGAATKRGYARGPGEDGGWFSEYRKDFVSVGIQVVLGFTGNTLPEENIPASVTTLSFRGLKIGRGGRPVPLSEVPPVLLAESHADYVAVAASGEFDADWRKKSGW